jgi:hypothetical protein
MNSPVLKMMLAGKGIIKRGISQALEDAGVSVRFLRKCGVERLKPLQERR